LVKQDKENSIEQQKKSQADLQNKINVAEERIQFLEEQLKKGAQNNNNNNRELLELQKRVKK
jgi:septal ring factor EnvC (AmiA/AmiB activator)